MGRKDHKVLIAWLCAIVMAGCVKDTPLKHTNTIPAAGYNVYIACEGQYPSGDATLYDYLPAKDSVYGDIFMAANGQKLGDVFQSMVRVGDKYFLCINNSDKVVVINVSDKKQVATIPVPQPRYMLPVTGNKAYVSSLYSNKVYVVNTQTYTVKDTIKLPNQNPEGMYMADGSVIICAWDTAGNNVYKVDVSTNRVINTFKAAGAAPQAVITDKEQMLWVLAGNQAKGKTATLTRIDPSTGVILAAYTFPTQADVIKPAMNPAKDSIYFIEVNYYGGTANNGIYRMGIHDATLPQQPFIAAAQYQYFWGLGVDPLSGTIYIGDPKGFNQGGSVYIYSPNGTQAGSFDVGVGPGFFYFDQ